MVHITSAADMESLGKLLGEQAYPSEVILLHGDLGAGKTTLTKGLARGLGSDKMVKSPTFTLVREYRDGRMPLFHLDLYRLDSAAAADDLGLEEYLDGDGITVIEWPQVAQDYYPDDYLSLTINRVDRENEREVTFQAQGQRAQALVLELEHQWHSQTHD